MERERFLLRFWGARGSYPVPGRHTLRYGGNTTCVELLIRDHPVIIDAGTGLIKLGADLIRRTRQAHSPAIVATMLITHTHHDHLQGFPYFAPNFIGSSVVNIFGPRTFRQSLEEVISHTVMPPNFPVCLHEMPSLRYMRDLKISEHILIDPETGTFTIYDPCHDETPSHAERIFVRLLRNYAHPRTGVYLYRVEWQGKSVVFASDIEGYAGVDQRLVEFARDTDVLIHDAHFSTEDYLQKQGWGHSTPQMACAVAAQCGAKQLVLVHHNPRYDDDTLAALEQEARQHFANTITAYEGLELALL